VRRRTKQIGAVLALSAMVMFVLPLCCWWFFQTSHAALVRRTRNIVEQNPQLQPVWDQAMQDKVLTSSEAQTIRERAQTTAAPAQ
jgi:hypothetical protein